MLKKLFMAFGMVALAFSSVSAQEVTGTPEPSNGVHMISPGFLPDPYIVTVRGGGEQNAMLLADGCVGFINETPDVAFVYETPASGFRIFFISDQDSTLMIQNPDGSYLCNDDSVDHDPAIEVMPGGAGTYLVWVGSFDGQTNPAGYLMLTEVYDTVAGSILSPIANFITSYIPMDEFIGPADEQANSGE